MKGIKNFFIKNKLIILILVAAIVFLGGIGWTLYQRLESSEERESTTSSEGVSTIVSGGTTILLIGLETNDELTDENVIPGNNAQIGALSLLCFDAKSNEVEVIFIPRETMSDVQVVYTDGTLGDVEEKQICLQYTYGATHEEAVALTIQSLEELLDGITIDDYVVVSQDAIAELNTFLENSEDEALPTNWEDWSTNQVEQLLKQCKKRNLTHWGLWKNLYATLDPYMVTSLSQKDMSVLGRKVFWMRKKNISTVELPGEWYEYTTLDEFHVDLDAWAQMME